MNLYFARRFACSSAQIGSFFSAAQIVTAVASLLGPAVARRYGKLRTAVAAQFLSLPFLVTLGAESHLSIAVAAFLVRATLMQSSTPLVNAFVMEVLPPELRARSSSLNNMAWNVGWAVSATFAGLIIERFGYAVPFYCTAALYAIAATTFYLGFRRLRDPGTREARPRDALAAGEPSAGL
jgi:predicted MFS family arabinose efflux permease